MLKTVVTVGSGTAGLTYKGTWNANTNSPSLSSGVGTNGDYYVVNVAGNTSLDGITDWQIGDWAIFNGTVWQKIDNTDLVVSVNGQVGVVVLTASNISGLGTMATQNANAVIITGGDATLNNISAGNVTIETSLTANLNVANVAAMTDPSIMLAPEGYIEVSINGANKKIPYYGV